MTNEAKDPMTQNDNQQTHMILDHIDQIRVRGAVFKEPANEYWALVSLAKGLEFLANQVTQCETIVKNRVNSAGNLKVLSFGNLPEFTGLPMGLLTCSFHWYAISACQYVRTVGVIAKRNAPERIEPIKYVEAIIPEVKAFRDKVAAHFAWASRNEKDSDADRMASIFPSVIWLDDHFMVGGHKLTMRKSGQVPESDSLAPWSVTVVHRDLSERYWKSSIRSDEESQPEIQS